MIDEPQRSNESGRGGSSMATFFLIILVLVTIGGASMIYMQLEAVRTELHEQTATVSALSKMLKEQVAAKAKAPDAAKQAFYARVTEAAAKAAAAKRTSPETGYVEAATAFKVLFNGPASMERDTEAFAAMEYFNRALDVYADADALEKLSMDLARVCGGPTAGELMSKNYAPSSTDPGLAALTDMGLLVQVAEAEFAAQKWLAVVDAGRYAESWNAAAELFKSTIPQDRWIGSMALRNSTGNATKRQLKSGEYTKSPAGSPPGEYVIVQFYTDFEGKPNSIETVTPVLEKDGKWRVAGYNIK